MQASNDEGLMADMALHTYSFGPTAWAEAWGEHTLQQAVTLTQCWLKLLLMPNAQWKR